MPLLYITAEAYVLPLVEGVSGTQIKNLHVEATDQEELQEHGLGHLLSSIVNLISGRATS